MIIDPYIWQSVRVTRIFHDRIDSVRIQTEKPQDYITRPGQHAIIRVTMQDGSTRLRQYSYANGSSSTFLEFAITRSQGGDVSNWFIDICSTSSIIEISQPFTGPLVITTSDYDHIGMIGGGSGIAPLLGYIRDLRDNNRPTQTSLVYTTRASSRLAHDVLQPTAHREQYNIRESDVEGRITDEEILSSVRDCDVILICGSRQFVTAIRDLCHVHIPKAELRAEAFSLI